MSALEWLGIGLALVLLIAGGIWLWVWREHRRPPDPPLDGPPPS